MQLNLVDIRPCQAEREATQVQREVYLRHRRCKPITADEAESLLPRRPDFTAVWRYLISHQDKGRVPGRFCVPVPQGSCATPAPPAPMSRIRVCLDVFDEMGLIDLEQQAKYLSITITAQGKKVDLAKSAHHPQPGALQTGGHTWKRSNNGYDAMGPAIARYTPYVNMQLINQAVDYAANKHANQVRQGRLPVYHPPLGRGGDCRRDWTGYRFPRRRPAARLH